MNLQHTLDKLYSLQRFGIKPGLERTLSLLDHVGNPHHGLRAIHVAGTNGKGSVCSMCASILQEEGYRVGLYTSPHVRRFNERIQINGELISDSEIAEYFSLVEPFIRTTEATFFEVTTVMCLLHFARHNTNFCVLETGMGGRFDSTNVIVPLLSIITSIDLDHQEYLGDTLEEICFEKAGIIKQGVSIVTAEKRDSLLKIIEDVARENQSRVVRCSERIQVGAVNIDERLHMLVDLDYDGGSIRQLQVPLAGPHQLSNLSCVIAAFLALKGTVDVSDKAIRSGLVRLSENTHLQSRIELYSQDPLIIIDVGHNLACVNQLVNTLAISPYSTKKFNIVFGVMADKQHDEMLLRLAQIASSFYMARPMNQRAEDSAKLCREAEAHGIVSYDDGTISKALTHAVHDAYTTGVGVLISGSFFVVEEALICLGELGILKV